MAYQQDAFAVMSREDVFQIVKISKPGLKAGVFLCRKCIFMDHTQKAILIMEATLIYA